MAYTFPGGVALDRSLSAHDSQIELMNPPKKVYIPLYSAGRECAASVEAGDHVFIGDVVGASDDSRTFVHASVSGEVSSIEETTLADGKNVFCVVIENDFENALSEDIKPCEKSLASLTRDDIISSVRAAGVSYGALEDIAVADFIEALSGKCLEFVIDMTESYPRQSSLSRLLIERTADTLNGAKLIMKALGVPCATIALTREQKEELAAIDSTEMNHSVVNVKFFEDKYPQSDPRLIITALTKREFANADDLAKGGYAVFDAGVCYDVYNAVVFGMPVVEKIITVSGAVVAKSNLVVPIGARFGDVVASCGIELSDESFAVADGVMAGRKSSPYSSTDKRVGAITVIKHGKKDTRERSDIAKIVYEEDFFERLAHVRFNCIACGECDGKCPMRLMPHLLTKYVMNGDLHSFEKAGSRICSECGICSYVCPTDDPFSLIRAGRLLCFKLDSVIEAGKKIENASDNNGEDPSEEVTEDETD